MKGYPKLKGLLVEKGLKQADVAEVLGIKLGALSNRLNGKTDFRMWEVKKLCEYLGITSDIFLG